MLANITVVTYNRLNLTKICLSSLLEKTSGDFIVNIVDNGSTDGTQEYLTQLTRIDPRVRVHLLARNMGVSVGANYGWAIMDAAYYVKLDNDIEILQADWLDELKRMVSINDSLGMVGYQIFAKHQIERVVLPAGDDFRQSDCSGGGCVLIPRRVHDVLGFWNEDYGRYGFEDLEYGNRARLAGWNIGYLDRDDVIEHLGHSTPVNEDYQQCKQESIAHDLSGEKLFVLNKLMFENNVRPLYVKRKYLPEQGKDGLRFRINPEYKSIIHLHQQVMKKVSYTLMGNKIALSLSSLKSSLGLDKS